MKKMLFDKETVYNLLKISMMNLESENTNIEK